jgi:hypothetical protein
MRVLGSTTALCKRFTQESEPAGRLRNSRLEAVAQREICNMSWSMTVGVGLLFLQGQLSIPDWNWFSTGFTPDIYSRGVDSGAYPETKPLHSNSRHCPAVVRV